MLAAERDAMDDAVTAVRDELRRAMAVFKPMASAHEGYAVLLEEMDELWHEVKAQDFPRMHDEAVQVAAMALRFLIDVKLEARGDDRLA